MALQCSTVHFTWKIRIFPSGVFFSLATWWFFTSALLIFPLHIQLTHSPTLYTSFSFNPSSTSSLHFRFSLSLNNVKWTDILVLRTIIVKDSCEALQTISLHRIVFFFFIDFALVGWKAHNGMSCAKMTGINLQMTDLHDIYNNRKKNLLMLN